jgi:hypothetical protein
MLLGFAARCQRQAARLKFLRQRRDRVFRDAMGWTDLDPPIAEDTIRRRPLHSGQLFAHPPRDRPLRPTRDDVSLSPPARPSRARFAAGRPEERQAPKGDISDAVASFRNRTQKRISALFAQEDSPADVDESARSLGDAEEEDEAAA